MQAIYKDKNERSNSIRADLIDIVICIGKISRYIEGKYTKRSRKRTVRIQDNRGIFNIY